MAAVEEACVLRVDERQGRDKGRAPLVVDYPGEGDAGLDDVAAADTGAGAVARNANRRVAAFAGACAPTTFLT